MAGPPPLLTLTTGAEALDRDCVPAGGPDVSLGTAFTRQGEAIVAPPMALMDLPPLQGHALPVDAVFRPAPTLAELKRRFEMLDAPNAKSMDEEADEADIVMNEEFVVLLPDGGECEYSFEEICFFLLFAGCC